VVSGLAFKVGVVPFHMWIPAVYHAAPSAVTLFISTGPKRAAFAMAIRLLVNALQPLSGDTPQFQSGWQDMLVVLSVLSMAIGNLAAIAQSNIKRMLAYSTISHMGFMLLGLLSGIVGGNALSAAEAWSSAMFYAVVYVLMRVGTFYYIRIVKLMYFDEPQDARPIDAKLDVSVLLSANGLAVLVLGVLPQPLMQLCFYAFKGL